MKPPTLATGGLPLRWRRRRQNNLIRASCCRRPTFLPAAPVRSPPPAGPRCRRGDDHADTIVPTGSGFPSNREGCVGVKCSAGQWGGAAAKGGRDQEDKHSRDGRSRLIPAMAGKGRCADRRAGTLGSRQTHEFSCSVAGGPQPARGGCRCQEPFDATLATLADALEAIRVNGCRRELGG
jgi:hypothetical protein